MDKLLFKRLDRLKAALKKMRSAVVAYSGGVDSTFLLKIARDVLGNKVLAVIADSFTYPKSELNLARKTAKKLGARFKVIKTREFKDKNFRKNPFNRCYFCKKELFLGLKAIAKAKKIRFVIDGSNLDDKKDFRPGSRARKELGIRSPLAESGFRKHDIRKLSLRLNLDTWDKPSLACLASRIPYGTKITEENLLRIDKAEDFLKSLGFKQVRARDYNGLCRIEVDKKEIPELLTRRVFIVDSLKKLGYNYVTVDLEGYRTGSMNPALSATQKHYAEKGRGE
ncbi:MAG: ATP-dependent sacrificial sulfur transferase LarE [Candidatus Omnitrophota bacterium]